LATNVDIDSTEEPPNLDGIVFQVQTFLPDNYRMTFPSDVDEAYCPFVEVGIVQARDGPEFTA
jgi:hypothetical protein